MASMNKRLPAELLLEIVASIPIMYLFGGIAKKPGTTRPPSGIVVINRMFEIFRAKRHHYFLNIINLARNFERLCALRKLPCGELFIQFGFIQFGFEDELEDAKYFADFLAYLSFGRSGPTATTRVVTYSMPVKIGELFGAILTYVLGSANPLTMKKRTAGGYLMRQHFPRLSPIAGNRNGVTWPWSTGPRRWDGTLPIDECAPQRRCWLFDDY
ncbi:hypothetical protein niasHT_005696 [Heterodera trifolii]|uniref:Uncharacterized protein n=1 Tax=Heterodera trifolii TaxID=157864 RepID=A0ABD2M3K0_9BILA